WKEAWLRRAVPGSSAARLPVAGELEALLARTSSHVRGAGQDPGRGRERWRCQATELPAASGHLKLWDPRAYIREYTSGNVSLSRFLRVTARAAVQEPMRKLGLIPEVHLPGTSPTPAVHASLDLQPGELVQVKSKEEIAATLTPGGRHRGMW